MNWAAINFDWNQLRAFLATAEEGSLSAAARALRLSQPTLGRQVSALEESLGVALFERSGRSLILTPTGADLLKHARAMADAAAQISLVASGQSQEIAGRVTISASDALAAYILPPVVRSLRELAPGIVLDIVATNSLSDLRRREADIAIRHVEPQEPEFYARRLRLGGASLYAARELAVAEGLLDHPERLAQVPFIGLDNIDQLIEWFKGQGLSLSLDVFRVFTGSGLVEWELVRQGLGVGVMMDLVADRFDGIVRLAPELAMDDVPTWLTTHRELRTSRRIRLVFDHLAAVLGTS